MKHKTTLLAIGLAAIIGAQAYNASAQPQPLQAGVPSGPSIDNYFTPSTADAMKPDDQGFIRRWLLLDPISKPNRSNTVFTDSYLREAFAKEYFPNQLTVLPKAGSKIKVMVEKQPPVNLQAGRPMMPPPEQKPIVEKATLEWHAFDSKLFNVKLFRLATGLNKDRYGVLFWAVTVINCDEDMNVRLAVCSNSASMWWLDGKEVLLLSGDRRMVVDDCVSPIISLKKGKNILRGAVINGPGMSDFCVRFLDLDGKPVTNYTITNK
jgi:hypothetical protein